MLQVVCYGSGLWGFSDNLLYCNLGWGHGSRKIKRSNGFQRALLFEARSWCWRYCCRMRRRTASARGLGTLYSSCKGIALRPPWANWTKCVWRGVLQFYGGGGENFPHEMAWGGWNVRTYSVSDRVCFLTSCRRRRNQAVWQDIRRNIVELHVAVNNAKMLSVAQKMILWRIYIASNSKAPLGLDLKCPIFLSDFKHVWRSSAIRYFVNP